MSERKEYAPGTFCWIELGTSNTEAGKEFYAGLFDWAMEDVPMDAGGQYTLLRRSGKDVAGLYALNEDQRKQGVPPHWLSYVAVTDADASAARSKELGGTVLLDPFDVMTIGRMAVIQDPTGAVFAVWQSTGHVGAGIVNEPATLCWNELMTNDLEVAGRFYTELFGWSRQEKELDGSGKYTIFMNGDTPAGGMMQTSADSGDVPSSWMAYFAVEDCDARSRAAKDLGGQVLVPPTDIPTVGRFSVVQDPQGAVFSMIRLEAPPES